MELPDSKNMVAIATNSYILFIRLGDQSESYWLKPNEDVNNSFQTMAICMSHDNQYISAMSKNAANQVYISTYQRKTKSDGSCIKVDMLNPPEERCIHCLNPAARKLNLDWTCGTTCLPEGGFDYDAERCAKCRDDNCKTCDANTCFECKVTYSLHLNTCVNPCPNTFYSTVTIPKSCLACQVPCQNCLSATHCMSCINPIHYVEQNAGTCGPVCPDEYRIPAVGRICEACPLNCRICNASPDFCEVCMPNFKLLNNGCIPLVQTCPQKTYTELAPPARCESCHISCLSCTSNTAITCLTCEQTYNRLGLNCIQDCGFGYFTNVVPQTCDSCVPNCGVGGTCTWSGDTDCQSCGLQGSDQLFHQDDSSCVLDCGDAKWGKLVSNTCETCFPGCKYCTGFAFADCQNHCTATPTTPYMLLSNNYLLTQCLAVCPSNMYPDANGVCRLCNGGCKTCTGPGPSDCTSCKLDLWLRDHLTATSDCVATCPTKKYKDPDGKCRDCHSDCGECLDPTPLSCTICQDPNWYISRDSLSATIFACIPTCPIGKYPDPGPPARECLPCTPNCVNCLTGTTCLDCAVDYHHWDFVNKDSNPNFCIPDPICDGQTWMNSTYECQLKCQERQVWVHPNTCYRCPKTCTSCQNITRQCVIDLDYSISLFKDLNDTNDLTLSFDLFKDEFPYSINKVVIENLQKNYLTLEAVQNSIKLDFKEYTESIDPVIKMAVTLPKEIPAKSQIKIKATLTKVPVLLYKTVDSDKIETIYQLVAPKEQIIETKTNAIIDEDSLARSKKLGKAMSATSSVAGNAADVSAVMASLMAADQSGSILKFSQICKLISRLRLLDINFGKELGGFLDGMGKVFDKDYSLDIDTQLKLYMDKIQVANTYGKGRQRKFDRYAVEMFLFGTMRNNWEKKLNQLARNSPANVENLIEADKKQLLRLLQQQKNSNDQYFDNSLIMSRMIRELKLWIYIFSFVIKLYVIFLINKYKDLHYITEGFIKKVQLSRKIHFVLFNLIAADVYFIGTRTALHARILKETRFRFIATIVILGMIFYDTIEIAWIAGNVLYQNGKAQKIAAEQKKEDGDTEKEKVQEKPFEFNRLECERITFGQNRTRGYGLRDFFYEDEMEKYVMTKETARNIGYVRVLDYKSNFHLMIRNQAVEDHATAELKKEDPRLYNYRSILISNFSFLVRIFVFHIVIVACSTFDGMQCILLLIVELSYLGFITWNFKKLRYLQSTHMFLSKFFQGFFLVVFQVLCLHFSFFHHKEEPPVFLQRIGMYSIMIAVIFEYVFLVVNIIYIIKELIKAHQEKKKNKLKEAENGEKKEEKKKGPDFVYKWVRKQNLAEETTQNKVVDFFRKEYKLKVLETAKKDVPAIKLDALQDKTVLDEINSEKPRVTVENTMRNTNTAHKKTDWMSKLGHKDNKKPSLSIDQGIEEPVKKSSESRPSNRVFPFRPTRSKAYKKSVVDQSLDRMVQENRQQ